MKNFEKQSKKVAEEMQKLISEWGKLGEEETDIVNELYPFERCFHEVTVDFIEFTNKIEALTIPVIHDAKVVAVSSNTNAFGLYGVILLIDTGELYECASNSLNVPDVGKIYKFKSTVSISHQLTNYGFEIPQFKYKVSGNALTDMWKNY